MAKACPECQSGDISICLKTGKIKCHHCGYDEK